MGAKTWMLVYADGDVRSILKKDPKLDRDATTALVTKLFPSDKLDALSDDGDLHHTNPRDDEIVAGYFDGLTILAAKEFAIDYPSKLDPRFIDAASGKTVYLVAMHSVVDWFAYAIWRNGKLQRALSLSPDSLILEDIGARLEFEQPYWAGKHPVDDLDDKECEYPLIFHPLELADAAVLEFFDDQLDQVGPGGIALMRFKRTPKSIIRSWHVRIVKYLLKKCLPE